MNCDLQVDVVILAGGRSTRFVAEQSKLLTPLCGLEIIGHVVDKCVQLGWRPLLVVGPHNRSAITAVIDRNFGSNAVQYVIQSNAYGTGDALIASRFLWNNPYILVINGDVPLLTSQLLLKFVEKALDQRADLGLITFNADNPQGYGRFLQVDGSWQIIEERDCLKDQLDSKLVNAGVYFFSQAMLQQAIPHVVRTHLSGEVNVTALFNFLAKGDVNVVMMNAPLALAQGVNTVQQFYQAQHDLQKQIISALQEKTVWLQNPNNVVVDVLAEIKPAVHLENNCQILGRSRLASGVKVGAGAIIKNSEIEAGTVILPYSIVSNCRIGPNCQIGPFAHLQDSVFAEESVLGNFVEIKRSRIGRKNKIKHLSYVGDVQTGQRINVGAGVVFCNYNGVQKLSTIVEDDVFVGSNCALVAPLNIGQGSIIAAGSTITKDVEAESLAVARAHQEGKPNYAYKLRLKLLARKSLE